MIGVGCCFILMNGIEMINRLMMPRAYSNRFVIRWTPNPDIIASLGSKSRSLKVNAHADSHVPKPPRPFMGNTEDNSAPVIPRMVLKKPNLLSVKPWL